MARRLVGCLLALLVRGDIDYAEISFYPPPPEKCAPTEITLTFEIAGGLQHLDTVYFYLNQFTRGGCNNGNGGKISDGLVLLGACRAARRWRLRAGHHLLSGEDDGLFEEEEYPQLVPDALSTFPFDRAATLLFLLYYGDNDSSDSSSLRVTKLIRSIRLIRLLKLMRVLKVGR